MKRNKLIKILRKIPFVYMPLSNAKNYIYEGKTYKRFFELYTKLQEKKVNLVYCIPPRPEKLKNLTVFEKERLDKWVFDFNHIDENLDMLKVLYGNNVSGEYIYQLYEGIKVIPFGEGKRVADICSKYVNISHGIRFTSDCPKEYVNCIHFYGACTARGVGVEDKNTIESFFQRILNTSSDVKAKVINHGIGCGSTLDDDLFAIENTVFHTGDWVILIHQTNHTFIRYCHKHHIPILESSAYIEKYRTADNWFIDDMLHTTEIGNEIIAQGLYDDLKEELSLQKEKYEKVEFCLKNNILDTYEYNQELEHYLQMLKNIKGGNGENTQNGSIVMNCNPFTLGHRYLIEVAASKVDKLYIFVVEEDKSFFPFADRIKLVKMGTSDLKNVYVLPSGKFIISALTFPGYFNKENDKTAIVDTSKDIDIFGKYIAPALNISVRFAGEEPLDMITRQYNQTMQERLPLYRIQFCEIPRKLFDNENVISASAVRNALKEKNYEKVKKMVPDTTYKYLLDRFGD